MSVINETLDNLKQTKKHKPKSLDPSASSYAGSNVASDTRVFFSSNQSMLIPLGLAVLLGIFFVVYHHNASSLAKPAPLRVSLSQAAHSASSQVATQPINVLAQGQYYTAMNLLNEGKLEQALLRLKEIMDTYPEFAPAKNAYSMLRDY